MPQLIRLRGRAALSPFRLEKLHAALPRELQDVRLAAEYWHFVSVQRPLSEDEHERLERLLTYGPRGAPAAEEGTLFLVVPRVGTISPWSSKATDIARHCALEAVERIERGIAYWAVRHDGAPVGPGHRKHLLPHIHDRMTEVVFGAFVEAERLFRHFEPTPLATIDVMGGGIEALERANRDLGLALSEDEIAYLAGHFMRVGRNPPTSSS